MWLGCLWWSGWSGTVGYQVKLCKTLNDKWVVWWWHSFLDTHWRKMKYHASVRTQRQLERRAVFHLDRYHNLCISLKPRWYPDVGVACIILHKTETQPQPLKESGLTQSKTTQLFPALDALEPHCPICCCSGTNLRVWGGSCAYLHMGHRKKIYAWSIT